MEPDKEPHPPDRTLNQPTAGKNSKGSSTMATHLRMNKRKMRIHHERQAWRKMGFPINIHEIFDPDLVTTYSGCVGMDLPHSMTTVFLDNDVTTKSKRTSGAGGYANEEAKKDDASTWAEFLVSEARPEDMDDTSPSRLEWLRQKREENEENPIIDKLMTMVGLEEVKAYFLAVKARFKLHKGGPRSSDGEKLRLHLVLQGKDGTGQ
jgi:hypothetical protein